MIINPYYPPEPPQIGKTMSAPGRKKRRRKYGKVGGGGTSWSSYWTTRLPYFALPATGVSIMVGREVTIYGDALISVPIGSDLTVTYTCDIGTQAGNNFVINPVAGDIGNHSLRMVFVSNGITREDKTIALSVRPETATNFSILRIGDSTINGEEIGTELDGVLDGCTITYLGTQGTIRKHEGYGGYRWEHFAGNIGAPTDPSPFFKAGVLDIAAYFTDNSIAVPNIINFRIGLNDIFQASAIGGDGLTAAELLILQNYAKILIDGFLAYDDKLKILISLPTTTENTGAGWDANYEEDTYSLDLYLEAMHKYHKALVDEFANGVYDARVDCSYEVINLDRDDGYPKTAGVHNNAVHFGASGAVQVADGLAININKYLSNPLARWRMNGDATDSIKDYDLTNYGGVLCPDKDAVANQAYDLIPANPGSLVRAPFNEIKLDEFTVSGWFKADALFNLDIIVGMTDLSSYGEGWAITWIAAGTKLRFFINSWNTNFVETTFNDTTSWHHVIASYKKTGSAGHQIRLRVDGGAVVEGAYSTSVTYTSSNFLIGQRNGPGYFDGKVDEYAVWNRQLTSAEELIVFNAGV